MKPFLENMLGEENYYFQQDNASIHKCKAVMEWLSENTMSVIEWPARSPDINLIENILKMLSDVVYDQKQFQNKDDLWLAIQNAT